MASVATPGMVWEGRADREENSTWAETCCGSEGERTEHSPIQDGRAEESGHAVTISLFPKCAKKTTTVGTGGGLASSGGMSLSL